MACAHPVLYREEAWLLRFPGERASVHRRLFPTLPAAWRDDALAARWETVRRVRRVVTGAMEIERRDKRIGSGLQSHPVIHLSPEDLAVIDSLDMAEIAIASRVTLSEGTGPSDAFRLEDVADVAVEVRLATGRRCERCWKVLDEVGSDPLHGDLCGRCASVVAGSADC